MTREKLLTMKIQQHALAQNTARQMRAETRIRFAIVGTAVAAVAGLAVAAQLIAAKFSFGFGAGMFAAIAIMASLDARDSLRDLRMAEGVEQAALDSMLEACEDPADSMRTGRFVLA